jgi:hypothetical protein
MVGQSVLLQHPVDAMQIIATGQLLGVVPPQVYPQVVPLQVAVAPAGGTHAVHDVPQL